DSLLILRPSDALRGPGYEPKHYQRLHDNSVLKELERDLGAMECTVLNLSLEAGLQKARKIADESQDKVTVHILSDFRKGDWTGPQAKELHKVMTQLGKHDNVKKVYLVDVAHPTRQPGQGGVPAYHDNVGIAEIRPSTRVASVGSTVFFTVTVVNY